MMFLDACGLCPILSKWDQLSETNEGGSELRRDCYDSRLVALSVRTLVLMYSFLDASFSTVSRDLVYLSLMVGKSY